MKMFWSSLVILHPAMTRRRWCSVEDRRGRWVRTEVRDEVSWVTLLTLCQDQEPADHQDTWAGGVHTPEIIMIIFHCCVRLPAQDIPDIYWEQAARELDFCTCRKCRVNIRWIQNIEIVLTQIFSGQIQTLLWEWARQPVTWIIWLNGRHDHTHGDSGPHAGDIHWWNGVLQPHVDKNIFKI